MNKKGWLLVSVLYKVLKVASFTPDSLPNFIIRTALKTLPHVILKASSLNGFQNCVTDN